MYRRTKTRFKMYRSRWLRCSKEVMMPNDTADAGTSGCMARKKHRGKTSENEALRCACTREDKKKLDFLVDFVHRVGVVRDDSSRPVIIQFTMRAFRNKIWKVSHDNKTLKEKKLFLKEDLTQADRMERNRLWPIVEEARKQGKRAGFRGPLVYIEEKKVTH